MGSRPTLVLLWLSVAVAAYSENGAMNDSHGRPAALPERKVEDGPVSAHEEVWQRGNDDLPEGNFETAKFLFRLTTRDTGPGKKQLWLTVEATHSNDFSHAGRDSLNYGVATRNVTQMRPYTDEDREKRRAVDKKNYLEEVAQAKLRYDRRKSALEARLEAATKELLALQQELADSKLAISEHKELLAKLEKKQEEVLVKLRLALRSQDKAEIKTVERELRPITLDLQEVEATEMPEPDETKLAAAATSERALRNELNALEPFSALPQPSDNYDSIQAIGQTEIGFTPRMAMFQYKDREFQKKVLESGPSFRRIAGQTIHTEVALGEFKLQPTTTEIVGEARICNSIQSIPKHMLKWRASVENGNLSGFRFEPYQVNGTPTKDSWRFESGVTILPDGTREASKRAPDQPLPQKANRFNAKP